MLKSVTVFCSASPVREPAILHELERVTDFLSERAISIYYGGAHQGLMGAVADSLLRKGGEVFGVMPRSLQERESAHLGLTHLQIVDDMMERKTRLLKAGDVILVLPGGLGTLDELFDALTWNSLGVFAKPVVLWNLNEFWTPLLSLFEHLVTKQVMTKESLAQLTVVSSTEDLLNYLEQL